MKTFTILFGKTIYGFFTMLFRVNADSKEQALNKARNIASIDKDYKIEEGDTKNNYYKDDFGNLKRK